MGGEAREDVVAITLNAANNADMFSRFREGDEPPMTIHRRDYLRVIDFQLRSWRSKHKDFGLLWNKNNIVSMAVFQSQDEEAWREWMSMVWRTQ